MAFLIIDAHAHCGRLDRYPPQDLRDYLSYSGNSGITGAVMFPPVMEIYDRYDPDFQDDPEWQRKRQEANEYLVNLVGQEFKVFPFFFIWNDFAVEQITAEHRGIKWHRHPEEPPYHYDDPRCSEAIKEIGKRRMPIVLEEEWQKTVYFIDELASEVTVIIPHCGLLNGGYDKFCSSSIWQRPNIYADTALAPASIIADYIKNYGHERIMFGSDFPFGDPRRELHKVLQLSLSDEETEAIIGGNIQRLMAESNR
jgi:uncharacterized protein